MSEIGIYARLSTTDQDPKRQLDELREFSEDTEDEPELTPTQTSSAGPKLTAVKSTSVSVQISKTCI